MACDTFCLKHDYLSCLFPLQEYPCDTLFAKVNYIYMHFRKQQAHYITSHHITSHHITSHQNLINCKNITPCHIEIELSGEFVGEKFSCHWEIIN
jgi:hypothetical protein